MKKEEIEKIYGNQYSKDNSFTKRARLLQSFYRVQIGETEFGVGPGEGSKRKDENGFQIPTKYGNIIVDL